MCVSPYRCSRVIRRGVCGGWNGVKLFQGSEVCPREIEVIALAARTVSRLIREDKGTNYTYALMSFKYAVDSVSTIKVPSS